MFINRNYLSLKRLSMRVFDLATTAAAFGLQAGDDGRVGAVEGAVRFCMCKISRRMTSGASIGAQHWADY